MTKRKPECETADDQSCVKKQRTTAKKKECPECGKLVTKLKQHLADKHDIGVQWFQCSQCPYKAKQQVHLTTHLSLCHNEAVKWFQCPHCPFKAKQQTNLKTHLAFRHNEGVRWFLCTYCPYRAKKQYHLTRHLAFRHNEGVRWFQCPYCPHKAKQQYHLAIHLAARHNEGVRWFQCPHCPHKAKQQANLTSHLAARHNIGVKWFQCPNCPHKTKLQFSLTRHIAACHNIGVKLFQCPYCPHHAKLQHNLTRHIAAMHDQGDLECPFCLNHVALLVPYKDANRHTSHVCRKCFKKASGFKTRAEEMLVKALRQHFGVYYLHLTNQVLSGDLCDTRTRPDAYLRFPEVDLHLFVECDEHQHRHGDYKPICERARMHEQCGEFREGHKVFIRWNPDGFQYDPKVHKLPKPKCRKDRLEVLVGYINRLVARLKVDAAQKENMGVPEVHYLYYSATNPLVVPKASEEFARVFV